MALHKVSNTTIAVDLDGIVADSDPKLREIIRRLSGISLTPEDITEWAFSKILMAKGLDPQTAERIEDETVRLFNEVECAEVGVIDGASDGLRRLADAGMSVVIATSRTQESEALTKRWLAGTGLPIHEVRFLAEKHRSATDWTLLIEDAAHNAIAVSGVGVPVYLMDYPYNRSISPHPLITRVRDWPEIVDLILK